MDSPVIDNEPPTAATPKWRIPVDSAIVSIGRSDDPDYDLENPSGVARLGSDRIIITDNNNASPVRVFSMDGKLVGKFRRGKGPGEFGDRWIPFVEAIDGSVMGYDGNAARLSVITESLTVRFFTRSRQNFNHMSDPTFYELAEGRWVDIVGKNGGSPEWDRKGVHRRLQQWVEVNAAGVERVLGEFPGDETVIHRDENGAAELAPVFGRKSLIAVRKDKLYLALNEGPEVEVRDTSGRVVRRIRVALPTRRVTAADRDRYTGDALARIRANKRATPEIKARWEERVRTSVFAEQFPFFDRMEVGRDGTVWLWPFRAVEDSVQEFWVFSETGRLTATGTLPAEYLVKSVGRDMVVVVTRDAEGHDLVQGLPVRRE